MISLVPGRVRQAPALAWAAYLGLGLLLALLPFVVDWGMGRIWVRILVFSLPYGMVAPGFVVFLAVGAHVYEILASPDSGIHLRP